MSTETSYKNEMTSDELNEAKVLSAEASKVVAKIQAEIKEKVKLLKEDSIKASKRRELRASIHELMKVKEECESAGERRCAELYTKYCGDDWVMLGGITECEDDDDDYVVVQIRSPGKGSSPRPQKTFGSSNSK